MSYQSIILTGDYLGPFARQQQAQNEQCICIVEFHFNAAADPLAQGGEVHYKLNDTDSRNFAEAMMVEIQATGLPAHGNQPVKSTTVATRSAWIDWYAMPAIVLEPLFISNPSQAQWLHDHMDTLAQAIAAAIKGSFLNGGRIGLSAGHVGKSQPDPGAPCALHDTEADHTVDLRDRVAALL